jgi:hypothetical protein
VIPVVYGCFALIVCLGFWVRRQRNSRRIAIAALASSLLFFGITNFAVWLTLGIYPKDVSGLIECYTIALPFFQNTLAGDLVYNAALFGGMALAEWRMPVLREAYVA